jgi:hypothetical protein
MQVCLFPVSADVKVFAGLGLVAVVTPHKKEVIELVAGKPGI